MSTESVLGTYASLMAVGMSIFLLQVKETILTILLCLFKNWKCPSFLQPISMQLQIRKAFVMPISKLIAVLEHLLFSTLQRSPSPISVVRF